jgi:hypothetical protein
MGNDNWFRPCWALPKKSFTYGLSGLTASEKMLFSLSLVRPNDVSKNVVLFYLGLVGSTKNMLFFVGLVGPNDMLEMLFFQTVGKFHVKRQLKLYAFFFFLSIKSITQCMIKLMNFD